MLQVPVLIEGVRLRLRRSTPADAQTVYAWARDPEVMRYMEWPMPRHLAETRAYLEDCAARWQAGQEHHWMVERKSDTLAIGCIAVRPRGHAADFGYFLGREHWGQGHAGEAASLLAGWLRRQGSIVRIWATTDVDNAASAAVLLKAGLQLEGVMRKATVRPNIGDGDGDGAGSSAVAVANGTPRDTALYASVKVD